MKKSLIIFSYSVYLFFLLGLLFHTSSHPQIFTKYTIKYVLFLLLLLCFFPLFLKLVFFISKSSQIKIKKRKYIFSPVHKLLACFLIVVLVVVLPLEVFLRQKYAHVESDTYQYSIKSFDPFLQYHLADNYTTPINSYGFRAEQITKQKSKGTYRIFVLGGSTVLGRNVSFDKTAVGLLEKRLQKEYPDKKIEVINAGVDGYTTEHSLIEYLFKIKDFDPDMIIMWHGINDFYYSCSPSERAVGPFKPDYSHFLGADAGMAFAHFQPQPFFQMKLLTYDFIKKSVQDNLYSDLINIVKKNNPNQGIYTATTKNLQYDMTSYPSLASYKRNLQSFIDAAKSDHVVLILGDQPALYSMHLDSNAASTLLIPKLHCTLPDGKYPSLKSMITGIATYNDAMKLIANKNDVPYVELAENMPKNGDYFIDDVHYTEKGNEKMAELLGGFIVEKQFIPSD